MARLGRSQPFAQSGQTNVGAYAPARLSRILTETALTGDALANNTRLPRALSEASATADTITTAATFQRGLAEGAVTLDSVTTATFSSRALPDTALTDDVVTTQGHVVLAETALSGDAVVTFTAQSRVLAENAATADAVVTFSGYQRALADNAATGDALVRTTSLLRALADSAFTADTVSIGSGTSIFDNAATADSVVRHLSLPRTLADTAVTTDTITRFTVFTTSVTATLVVSPSVYAYATFPPPTPVPGPRGLHDYEVIVVDKYGIAFGQIVSAVPTQIDWVLNDIGQALIDFWILDPSAKALLPLTVLPGAREIQIWRDQELIWWGWPTSASFDAKQVHLTCAGLLFPFSKRNFGPITSNFLLNADFETPATLDVVPNWDAIGVTANVTPADGVAAPLLNSFMAKLVQAGAGEDTYLRQYVAVTGDPGIGTFYTLSAWVYIDPAATFSPAFGQNGVFIQFIEFLTVAAGPAIQQITADTARGQWTRLEIGVEVPPGASGVLEIRLYAPQGVTYWDACRLTIQESVGSPISGADVQFIMDQIITYAQDPTRAKSDLAIPFAGPLTGKTLVRDYQFFDNGGILDALNEFPTIGVCDFECVWDESGHFRQFVIYPPAKGSVKYNFPIEVDLGSITDLQGGIDGSLTITTSRVLGQGSTGSSEDLGWAAFPSALGGRVALDGVFTQGSNIIESATIAFTSEDVGEGVYCQEAGVLPIGSTIATIIDSTHATFTSNQGGGAMLDATAVLGIGGIVLDDVQSALPDLPIGTLQGTAEGNVLRRSQTQLLPTARQRADGPTGLMGRVSPGDVVPVMFNYGWLTFGPVLMRIATLSLYPVTEEIEAQLNVVPIGENVYG